MSDRHERRPRRVHVWAYNRTAGHWYGEGISQVVTRLLSSFTDLTAVVYVHPDDESAATAVFRAAARVQVTTSRPPWRPSPGQAHGDRRGLRKLLDRARLAAARLPRKLATQAARATLERRFRQAAQAGECVYFPSPTLAFDVQAGNGLRVVSFWDNFVAEFPQYGPKRGATTAKLRATLARADLVITQSQANRRYLESVFGLSPDAIEVIELGGNDYAHLLQDTALASASLRTLDTGSLVALWRAMSPAHATDTPDELLELSTLYRLREGFEPADRLIMVSTQDRPHKNLDRLLEVVDALKRGRPGIKLAFTTVLTDDRRRQWNLRFPWTIRDVFEFPRLTAPCHALLYRLADLVIHPSLVEGGPTPFPAFEAASLGTPALMQEGRHTRELADRVGAGTHEFCVDLFDAERAPARIRHLLDEPDQRTANVRALLASCDSWGSVSRRFEAALAARMMGRTPTGWADGSPSETSLPNAA
jgi:glycosyltransferase involved in cell wall biosynthesis